MRNTTGWARRAALAASVAVAAAVSLAPPAIGIALAQQAGATAQAREHFTRGKQLFASGEYRGAIAEFAAADKLVPSPLLEFNIALCHERLGERAEAVRRYKLYLERVPDADNRSAVEAKISRLEADLKAETAPRPAAPLPLVPPPVGDGAGGPPPPGEGAPEGGAEPAPTGDPELDRAAKIDIGKLRAQRGAAPPPEDRSAAGAPPPDAAPPPSAPPPRRDEGEKKEKPIYKRWWFWVVAGVGAAILVTIALSDSNSDDGGRARMLPFGDTPRDLAQPGGAVLLRF